MRCGESAIPCPSCGRADPARSRFLSASVCVCVCVRTAVQARGALSEEEARIYFSQLISCVDYCHSASVCHRCDLPDRPPGRGLPLPLPCLRHLSAQLCMRRLHCAPPCLARRDLKLENVLLAVRQPFKCCRAAEPTVAAVAFAHTGTTAPWGLTRAVLCASGARVTGN